MPTNNPISSEQRSVHSEEGDKPVFITQNSRMQELHENVRRIAATQASVLLTGESGTGKEVFARLIHYESARNEEDFIALNCSALPKELIESELFGHEKGAFTGASGTRAGCFELAHNGTLFLDEIAEMNPSMQVKLLRAIEGQSFRRVGGHKEIQTDVRIVAATNKDMQTAIDSGEFREDLYYRLNVVELWLPPLRERKEDIPLLIEHFLSVFINKYKRDIQGLTGECLEKLIDYDWPGNIRELRNIVERLVIMSSGKMIVAQTLPLKFHSNSHTGQEHSRYINIPVGTSMEEVERLLINRTLSQVGNNKSEASRILGVTRQTLRNKLQRYDDYSS